MVAFLLVGPDAPGRVEQPFTFSGHIAAFTNPSLTGVPVFAADLFGTGIAAAVFAGSCCRLTHPPTT